MLLLQLQIKNVLTPTEYVMVDMDLPSAHDLRAQAILSFILMMK
mgnify:CR=1 FL=1